MANMENFGLDKDAELRAEAGILYVLTNLLIMGLSITPIRAISVANRV
jgi:hypothetical protein